MPGQIVRSNCTCCAEDCTLAFTCTMCGFTKNTCSARIGGFDATMNICVTCFEDYTLPKQMIFLMRRKEAQSTQQRRWAAQKRKQREGGA